MLLSIYQPKHIILGISSPDINKNALNTRIRWFRRPDSRTSKTWLRKAVEWLTANPDQKLVAAAKSKDRLCPMQYIGSPKGLHRMVKTRSLLLNRRDGDDSSSGTDWIMAKYQLQYPTEEDAMLARSSNAYHGPVSSSGFRQRPLQVQLHSVLHDRLPSSYFECSFPWWLWHQLVFVVGMPLANFIGGLYKRNYL